MRLLILDGNSLINRAFYGVKPLSTKDGLYTNALFGFLNMLQKLRDTVQPTHMAVAFDVHAPTFRHTMYDAYKAGRKGMPDELAQQMPVLKQLLTHMGIPQVELAGYEADDLLGTLSAAAKQGNAVCWIATGDRDALQLVDEQVTVLLTATRMGHPETVVCDPNAIQEKYGLTPAQLIDLKALMGDSSDNIPGVPGVGEKTALSLLHEFGSMDALYDALETAELRESLRSKLRDGKDSAYLSRDLGTICRTAPIDTDLSAYALRPIQREELARLLVRLEFFKMLEKWGLNEPSPSVNTEDSAQSESSTEASADLPVLTGEAAAQAVLAACEGGTTPDKPLDFLADTADGIVTALWVRLPEALAHIDATDAAFGAVVDRLLSPTVCKRTHDAKHWFAALLNSGRTPTADGMVMDTLLAAYLTNPLASGYDLPRLEQEYLPDTPTVEAADTAGLLRRFSALADRLERELEAQGQRPLLRDMEIPLALVLADMERLGFRVDADGIAAFGNELGKQIDQLQQGVYTAVGYEFNLNSPKQLGKALFEDLGLPAKKKTRTGYSTNAEVLEGLRDKHPAVEMLLAYRTLAKLKSTYCDGLTAAVAEDGRIHSSFNQTETRTGRISSTEPNLQNIPVRSELGRELRRFFTAEDGWVLCDADYSQIELRVLAGMSGDPTMTAAFNGDEDIHTITASQVFGVPADMVTPLMRSRAKAVNFGIVYGIGAHSLSQDIGVSYGEAKDYISGYLHHYGAVAGFMEQLIKKATEDGFAVTLFGRRRPVPELRAGNHITRSFGERVARNAPIQGTAADIIKLAMIRVYDRLRREGLRARLILQVHDELIVEAPAAEAEAVTRLLQEEMESAAAGWPNADLPVKLAVDGHVGGTWYDAKG